MKMTSGKWAGRLAQVIAISGLLAGMALTTACETMMTPGQGKGLYAEVYETRRSVTDMKTDQGETLRRMNDLLVEMDKKISDQDKLLRESKDDLQRQIKDLQGEMKKAPVASAYAPTTAGPGLNETIPPVSPAPTAEEQQLFDAAQADMQAKNYDAAMAKINQFLSAYPNSQKAAEALYQLGKANYEKAKYADAAAAFERIHTQYPNATTVIPLAMHAQALAEYKQQQNGKARQTLEQLKELYPDYEPKRVDDMLNQIPAQ